MDSIYLNNNIYLKLAELIGNNPSCSLATVTETFGSTPQKAGSSVIVGSSGLIAGTVGGGIAEQQILEKAANSIQSKKSCYCRFDLNKEITEEEAGICGGDMNILLDASPEKHFTAFNQLIESVKSRIPGVLISVCESGSNNEFEIQRFWATPENISEIAHHLNSEVIESIRGMLQKPVSGDFRKFVKHTSPEYEDNYVFLESITPKPRLIIAGAGHIGKALSHYGKLLDFDVTVWDSRNDKACKENLPDADEILDSDLEKSLGALTIDRNTYIVIATHGHKNDTDVLKLFINSPAGYIGMIGSKRKVEQVREKFIANGWANKEKWKKIHAPIGLDIHSKSVQEIALSIAAQLVQVRFELSQRYE